MAFLFEFVAFMTLTLSQSASISNDTNAADTASAGEMRHSPVVRERGQPVCRTRYLYHPEEADWEGAKALCEMEGAQLAVITSEAEQGRIASRFGRLPEFWVGCTDIEREGQFRWVNGQGLDLLAGTALSRRGNIRTTNIASLSITGAKTPNGATAIVTILGPFSAKPWCANPRVVVSRLDIRAPSKDL